MAYSRLEKGVKPMNRKILILEDNEDLGKMYMKLLKSHGYDSMLAVDGLEGLDMLQQMSPDLIIMDVSMPRMSGVGFYESICDLQGKPRYPLLVVTGRLDLEATFKQLPVAGLILKPCKREQLLKEVEAILGSNKNRLLALNKTS
jgi:DNA-binding response OmpR family regulator